MDLVQTNMEVTNIVPTQEGIQVLVPNNATLTLTHTASLNIPTLPAAVWQVHIFPQLASGSLLSINQLYDNGCTATFDKNKLYIYYWQHYFTRAPTTNKIMDYKQSTSTLIKCSSRYTYHCESHKILPCILLFSSPWNTQKGHQSWLVFIHSSNIHKSTTQQTSATIRSDAHVGFSIPITDTPLGCWIHSG